LLSQTFLLLIEKNYGERARTSVEHDIDEDGQQSTSISSKKKKLEASKQILINKKVGTNRVFFSFSRSCCSATLICRYGEKAQKIREKKASKEFHSGVNTKVSLRE
jgi:hypothetical protein